MFRKIKLVNFLTCRLYFICCLRQMLTFTMNWASNQTVMLHVWFLKELAMKNSSRGFYPVPTIISNWKLSKKLDSHLPDYNNSENLLKAETICPEVPQVAKVWILPSYISWCDPQGALVLGHLWVMWSYISWLCGLPFPCAFAS